MSTTSEEIIIMRMDIVNISNRQPHSDEKCQFKAIHGSSINDTHTTGQTAAVPKTTLYTGTAKLLPHVFKQHKSKLKEKMKRYIQR